MHALTKNMKCLSLVVQHLKKPVVVSLQLVVLQLVILMSVYLPERRLNFQLNRKGPAVLNAYVIHFSLENFIKTLKIIAIILKWVMSSRRQWYTYMYTEFLISFEAWAKLAQKWLVCVSLGIHIEQKTNSTTKN